MEDENLEKKKKLFSMLLIVSILCSTLQGNMALASGHVRKDVYQGNGFAVMFQVDQTWGDGYSATVTVKNTGEEKIENWSLSFPLAGEITNLWNAVIKSSDDGMYMVKNVGWNQDIPVGSQISFGFVAKGSFADYPSEYTLRSTLSLVDSKRYQLEYTVVSDWTAGFNGSMTITNVSDADIEDWKLSFSFENKISQLWNASILREQDGKYVLDNQGYNANIRPRQSVTFGFQCKHGDATIHPQEFALREYTVQEQKTSPAGPDTEKEEGTDERQELTEDNAAQFVHIEMQQGNTERCVINDIVLVNDAEGRYDVEWISSDPAVISDTGKVTRPQEDRTVVMTAVVSEDNRRVEVPFSLQVRAKWKIDVSELEDYSLEDLGELNRDNADFETVVNDFGYLQEVYGTYSGIRVDSCESALYSLYHVRSAIGIKDPFTELTPYRTFVDDTGYTFQFAQTIQGVTTFDNLVTVSADREGRTDYLKSGYYPVDGRITTTPKISYKEAEGIIAKRYGAVQVQEEDRNRICVVNYYGNVDLVWDIHCQIDSADESIPSGSYRVLVGAADGEIKYRCRLTSNAVSTERVKAAGRDLAGTERSFYVQKKTEKHITGTKTSYALRDPGLNITVKEGEGNDAGITREEKDPVTRKANEWKPEEISAMYHMKKIFGFYYSQFKRVSYANNNHREKSYTYNPKREYYLKDVEESKVCLSRVEFSNALWDDRYKAILVGTGDGAAAKCVNEAGTALRENPRMRVRKVSYAIGKDILCHEYTHALMFNDTNLGEAGSVGIPGAVNEAYADIAACFMDGNWKIGEELFEELPLRNLADPNRSCTASEVKGKYYVDPTTDIDHGGIYANSTVISHAVFRMKKNGIELPDLMDIWYNTIRGGLDSKTNFYSVRKLFLLSCARQRFPAAKKDRYADIINRAFDAANVRRANCNLGYQRYGKALDQQVYCGSYFCSELSFQGTVVEADGDLAAGNNRALPDVEIRVRGLENGRGERQAVTDQTGRYRITSALHDGYAVTFQKQGYLDETMYLSGVNELIQTEYYCDTVEMTPVGRAGAGSATGRLLNAATLRGVPGMTLAVRRGMNNIYTDAEATICTDRQGRYALEGMEAGVYCLELAETEEYAATFFNVRIFGGMTLSEQNGYISSVLERGQMRVVLTWGDSPADLDAHMICKLSNGSSGHVSFMDTVFDDGKKKICALDVDEMDGYGPETITMYYGKTGWYHYYVKQYSVKGTLAASNACVRVYLPGEAHPSYTYHVPAGQGRYWDVFRFNSATQRMVSSNKIEEHSWSFLEE